MHKFKLETTLRRIHCKVTTDETPLCSHLNREEKKAATPNTRPTHTGTPFETTGKTKYFHAKPSYAQTDLLFS